MSARFEELAWRETPMGEITLRRLVELAGMSSKCDFVEQLTVDSDDGRQRPDMLINLPGDRQVVIDCKAVLEGFIVSPLWYLLLAIALRRSAAASPAVSPSFVRAT